MDVLQGNEIDVDPVPGRISFFLFLVENFGDMPGIMQRRILLRRSGTGRGRSMASPTVAPKEISPAVGRGVI